MARMGFLAIFVVAVVMIASFQEGMWIKIFITQKIYSYEYLMSSRNFEFEFNYPKNFEFSRE